MHRLSWYHGKHKTRLLKPLKTCFIHQFLPESKTNLANVRPVWVNSNDSFLCRIWRQLVACLFTLTQIRNVTNTLVRQQQQVVLLMVQKSKTFRSSPLLHFIWLLLHQIAPHAPQIEPRSTFCLFWTWWDLSSGIARLFSVALHVWALIWNEWLLLSLSLDVTAGVSVWL